ncbi:hypothetical protein [Micromonospora aurantiaca (nom. illeg.)]|uniref:hypothetical protein n=1 Tax=Micromonospora aurantiaca (nom. illeg.) TaxID=47850 RepID=UPI003EB89D16
MTSLLVLPVADVVELHEAGLAILHRAILDKVSLAAGALDEVNAADAGEHPGHVLAPVVRRGLGPQLRADLADTGLALKVIQFDAVRLIFSAHGGDVARVRKRNPNSLVLSNMPQLEMFAGFRPGELAILWEPDEQQQQLRSIVLARVDAASWNKKEWVIFEEAPLPPPAAKSYAPPAGSSNDDDDLADVVNSVDDRTGTEDIDTA